MKLHEYEIYYSDTTAEKVKGRKIGAFAVRRACRIKEGTLYNVDHIETGLSVIFRIPLKIANELALKLSNIVPENISDQDVVCAIVKNYNNGELYKWLQEMYRFPCEYSGYQDFISRFQKQKGGE